MNPQIHTYDDVARLLAKGRAARANYLTGLFGSIAARTAGLVKAVAAGIRRRAERAEAARRLRQMDARMLADIGLTPGDIELAARGELARPRPPKLRAANESVAPAREKAHQAA